MQIQYVFAVRYLYFYFFLLQLLRALCLSGSVLTQRRASTAYAAGRPHRSWSPFSANGAKRHEHPRAFTNIPEDSLNTKGSDGTPSSTSPSASLTRELSSSLNKYTTPNGISTVTSHIVNPSNCALIMNEIKRLNQFGKSSIKFHSEFKFRSDL
jgi:hypothetical protein